jgi:hypothetical protein
MKNTILSLLSSKLAIAGFVLAGLLLFAPDSTYAQSTKLKGVDYVSEAEAISRLEIETAALKDQISVLTPGSFAYKSAMWKYEFFDIVLNHLYQGKTVMEAVELGSKSYYTDRFAEMPSSLKKTNISELKLLLQA